MKRAAILWSAPLVLAACAPDRSCPPDLTAAGDPEDGEERRAAQVFADDQCGARKRIVGTTEKDIGPSALFAPPSGGCLFGLKGDDELTGAQGDDVLYGGKGKDVMIGGAGADLLVGGLGPDVMNGGAGNDTYLLYPPDDQASTNDTIEDPEGDDTIKCMDGLRPVNVDRQGDTVVLRFANGGTVTIARGARFKIDCEGAGPVPGSELNSFRYIGRGDTETLARIEKSWERFKQCYITAEGAVNWFGGASVESQTRTLMIAFLLGKRDDFERILNWTTVNMLIAGDQYSNYSGPNRGYMAWKVGLNNPVAPCNNGYYASSQDGPTTPAGKADVGGAGDGEIWITTALLLAGTRWGRPDWVNRAKQNMALYVTQPPAATNHTPLFDPTSLLPVFVRTTYSQGYPGAPKFNTFTSPAYPVPSFFDSWAKSSSAADWARAADSARVLFDRATSSVTGLIAESISFDGVAVDGSPTQNGLLHAADSPQAAINRVLDWQTGNRSPSISENAADIIRFYDDPSHPLAKMFAPDGRGSEALQYPSGRPNPASREQNAKLQQCMLGVWAVALPDSEAKRAQLEQLWSDDGWETDWYSMQYCLLGKVIVAGYLANELKR